MKNKYSYKIAIDAFGIDNVGGGRSATLPYLKHLPEMMADCYFYYFLSQYEDNLVFKNVKQIILPIRKGIIARLAVQLFIPIVLLIKKIDLVHFMKCQGSLVFKSRCILTIYDATIIRHPNFFSKPSVFYWNHIQRLIASRMDKIITISNDAKEDIIKFLKIPSDNVTVIYPSSQFDNDLLTTPDHDYSSRALNEFGLPFEYNLFVGQIGLKKNLDTLIRAYSLINEKVPNFPQLIMVGPRYSLSDAGKIFVLISELGLESKIRYLGPLDPTDLLVVFKNSKMLIFPSIHEGFGIPCLEAMSLGIPILASKIPVIAEVVKDAGELVEDYMNPNKWAQSIVNLYNDSDRINELIRKGKIRSNEFLWTKAVSTLASEYYELLAH